MKQSLLVLCRIQRCHFHGRDDLSDRTWRLHSSSELTAHTVQLDVFVSQVQVLPLLCLAFPEYKLQQEEAPSAWLCCRAASPPLAPISAPLIFPRSPAWLQGSGDAELCSNAANPTCAGCFEAGSTDLPSSGTTASLSPSGKWLFKDGLDRL